VDQLAPDLFRTDLYRLTVSVRFHMAVEGGRSTPVASDYRPDCWFGLKQSDGERLLHGCVFFFRRGGDAYEDDGTLWVKPGGRCTADALVRYPSYLRGRVAVGDAFEAQEGSRVVASGKIESIFDPGRDLDP